MDSQTSYDLCNTCEISKNFPTNRIPKRFTYMECSNQSSNEILLQIFKSGGKLIEGNRFIIIVDGSRYGIEIISKTLDEVILTQNVLHYDSKRGQLVAVYTRYVKITL